MAEMKAVKPNRTEEADQPAGCLLAGLAMAVTGRGERGDPGPEAGKPPETTNDTNPRADLKLHRIAFCPRPAHAVLSFTTAAGSA